METLDAIWQWILGITAGLTATGILTAIICGCLKGAFNKVVSKINVEKISDKAVEKGVERVKKITFEHNIQPIVESEAKKVGEQMVKDLKEETKTIHGEYAKIIEILGLLANYFDNSIGVPENCKEALHSAINLAQNWVIQPVSVVCDEPIKETKNEPLQAKNESVDTIKVSR